MDEQKKVEENKEEESTGDKDEGSKFETTPIIERAREEREKLEAANKKKEELLNREEELIAKRALGGESEAGIPEQKPVKLTDKEYAEALERGEVDPLKEDGFK